MSMCVTHGWGMTEHSECYAEPMEDEHKKEWFDATWPNDEMKSLSKKQYPLRLTTVARAIEMLKDKWVLLISQIEMKSYPRGLSCSSCQGSSVKMESIRVFLVWLVKGKKDYASRLQEECSGYFKASTSDVEGAKKGHISSESNTLRRVPAQEGIDEEMDRVTHCLKRLGSLMYVWCVQSLIVALRGGLVVSRFSLFKSWGLAVSRPITSSKKCYASLVVVDLSYNRVLRLFAPSDVTIFGLKLPWPLKEGFDRWGLDVEAGRGVPVRCFRPLWGSSTLKVGVLGVCVDLSFNTCWTLILHVWGLKKSEDVSVDSVMKRLNELEMKDNRSDDVATKEKQKKGTKIKKKVVRKTLKSVKKSLKKESKKKDFTGDADVLRKKRKY
ncbi:hypothetical protein Tco_0088628 [Tanacetum coccineum]